MYSDINKNKQSIFLCKRNSNGKLNMPFFVMYCKNVCVASGNMPTGKCLNSCSLIAASRVLFLIEASLCTSKKS